MPPETPGARPVNRRALGNTLTKLEVFYATHTQRYSHVYCRGLCTTYILRPKPLDGAWIMNAEELATTQDSLSLGQVVRKWNEICRAQDFGNPLRHARQLAIMHTAMHDAVNGVDARYERHLDPLGSECGRRSRSRCGRAQGAGELLPANQALDAELANSLSMIPDGPAKTAGVALGAAIGQEAFDARINDGFSSVEPFVPPVGVGFWKPTPPAFAPIVEPQFQNVTPFGIKAAISSRSRQRKR